MGSYLYLNTPNMHQWRENRRIAKIKKKISKKSYSFQLERVKLESHMVVTGLWSRAFTSGRACLPWLVSGGWGASLSIRLSRPLWGGHCRILLFCTCYSSCFLLDKAGNLGTALRFKQSKAITSQTWQYNSLSEDLRFPVCLLPSQYHVPITLAKRYCWVSLKTENRLLVASLLCSFPGP